MLFSSLVCYLVSSKGMHRDLTSNFELKILSVYNASVILGIFQWLLSDSMAPVNAGLGLEAIVVICILPC